MTQNSFFLAAGVSLAMALTFSCSSDGSDGKDGAQGLQGETGAGCIVSSVDEGTKITCGASTVVIPNAANGTNGTDGIDGANGADGADGAGCTAEQVEEGIELTCGGNPSVLIPNGSKGESCEAEQDSDGIITITCGGSTVGIAFCGEDNKLYNPINQLCEDGIVYDFFTDSRDNKKYVYVEIGDYIWMTENLVYGKADGEYTWAEALEACPAGWELPTKDVVEDVVTNNETEFLSILSDGSNDKWWTVDEYTENANRAYYYGYDDDVFFEEPTSKTRTIYVRCVKEN